MIKIAIIGALGKMGKTLCSLCLDDPKLKLASVVEKKDHPHLTKDIGKLLHRNETSIFLTDNLDEAITLADIIIDFSSPTNLDPLISKACLMNKKLVIGTTSLENTHISLIENASKTIPIFYSANFSLGIAIISKLLQHASISFKDADIHITETHHSEKKDSPSGTALMLANTIEEKVQKNIPTHSIRIGNVIGEHKVKFSLEQESVIIEHIAHDRNLFAKGAIMAAKFLIDKPNGLYSMQDLIGN